MFAFENFKERTSKKREEKRGKKIRHLHSARLFLDARALEEIERNREGEREMVATTTTTTTTTTMTTRTTLATIVAGVFFLLFVFSLLLLLYYSERYSYSLLIFPPLTHAYGVLRKRGYKVYMPGAGNYVFVTLQALGWISFAVSVVSVLLHYFLFVEEFLLVVIVTSFVSHFCVAMSLHHWKGDARDDAKDFLKVFITSLSLTVLHGLPLIVFSMLFALAFFVRPAFFIGLLATYAVLTCTLVPSDADNTIEMARQFVRNTLMVGLTEWHGEISISRDVGEEAEEEEEDSGRLIFGYSPHAFIPHSAAWLHLHADFEQLFPNRQVCTLAASIIFRIPVVREIFSFTGARSVSRSSFLKCLYEGKSVMFVPGGQSELYEHTKNINNNEIVICTKHKGFIRIAMNLASDYQEKIKIIPIVAFGEAQGVRNVFKRFISKKFYHYFGFPFPFIPVGIYGTPFPARQPLYFAIGKGVVIEPNTSRTIEEIHEQYYEQVRTLFEKHKKLAKNSAHLSLRLVQS